MTAWVRPVLYQQVRLDCWGGRSPGKVWGTFPTPEGWTGGKRGSGPLLEVAGGERSRGEREIGGRETEGEGERDRGGVEGEGERLRGRETD